jgi:hypothetical protein
MPKLQVFDPAMCCPTGVCGPAVDPALVRFSADLDWLKSVGIQVDRYNLSQEPAAFVANAVVAEAMRGRDDALPVLLLDGKIVAQGSYPERAALASLVGIAPPEGATRPAPSACCAPTGATPVALGTSGAPPKKCC